VIQLHENLNLQRIFTLKILRTESLFAKYKINGYLYEVYLYADSYHTYQNKSKFTLLLFSTSLI